MTSVNGPIALTIARIGVRGRGRRPSAVRGDGRQRARASQRAADVHPHLDQIGVERLDEVKGRAGVQAHLRADLRQTEPLGSALMSGRKP